MSGTDLACPVPAYARAMQWPVPAYACYAVSGTGLRACYAMSGTDIAYQPWPSTPKTTITSSAAPQIDPVTLDPRP
eukprot:3306390-Rhodomonas_salina.1